MARLLFPSEADRLVYQTGLAAGLPLNNTNGVNILIYTDLACSTLANVQNEDGSPNAGSIFAVGTDSQIPSFLGPDGVSVLYARPQNQAGNGYKITPRIVASDYAPVVHVHDYATTGHSHAAAAKTVRIPHTFTISGEVKVAVGSEFYIPPFYVPVPAGQAVSLVGLDTSAEAGTSATFSIKRQVIGSATTDVPGLTGIVSTATASTAASATPALSLSNRDRLYLVITAVSGTPKNLTVTLYLDYTV